MKIFSIIIFLLFNYIDSFSQVDMRFMGILGSFQFEEIELYPDFTFKWTRKYDLCWSDYGQYEINGSKIKLKYKLEFMSPTTMSLKDTLNKIDTVLWERVLLKSNDKLYWLNSKNKKIKWLRNNFFDNRWSWMTLGFHRLKYIKLNATNKL